MEGCYTFSIAIDGSHYSLEKGDNKWMKDFRSLVDKSMRIGEIDREHQREMSSK